MMTLPDETYLFADSTVNINPDAERLAAITLAAARFVKHLGIEPQIALISFSDFDSARHPESEKVAQAVRLFHERYPDLAVDGEMQVDTAVVESLLLNLY
jgi:malate dehydrogenase (oxaloacetate-decarboxylating)(NADP+)